MNKIKSGLAILTIAMLAGCQQQPNAQDIGMCWNADTKETVNSMVKNYVAEYIADGIAKNDKTHTKAQITAWVKARVITTLSNFYVLTADPVTGNVTCGADAAMTFKRGDKTYTGSGASFTFAVYNAEGDNTMYSVTSRHSLTQMVDDATVSPDAGSAKPSPASATQ
ncbi:hypothetical protein [Pandoraea sp.]|uniref:hypothetical protein n=1 Tax=Pandoraea sp. TaxID=1883445 RepID=UPI00120B2C9D|nr:hypothetical protein [Pandoraea sp.]TAL55276.1 MAG: hypothetical protein EPN80_07970 [Pandoraea sp.]TAM18194.1 MAG: hypothetical protein EPN65_07840 [Pandoraea sp.]